MWGAHSRTNSPRGSGSLNSDRKGPCCNCNWACNCVWVWAWAGPPSRKEANSAAEQIRTNIRSLYRKFRESGVLHSVGSNKHRLRSRDCNRRAAVGEGADAGQIVLRRTRHRGTSQDEGEGEDEADGAHLTVSG